MELQDYIEKLRFIKGDKPISFHDMSLEIGVTLGTLMRIIHGTNKNGIQPRTERKIKDYIADYERLKMEGKDNGYYQ